MFYSFMISLFVGSVGFIVGTLVGAEETRTAVVNTLEQKIALLERENEELQEANEEWSEEYEKVSKDLTLSKNMASQSDSLCVPIIGVLACIILVNAISIYISILVKAKL